jgi:hypothetical protein
MKARHITSDRAHRLRVTRAAAFTLTLMLASHAAPTAAAPLTAVGGYDHYAGPFGQRTDGALAALIVGAARSDFMIAGVRYDDTTIGPGYSVTAGIGVPVGDATRLRVAGTRFIGDDSFRAWRAKVGPQFDLPGGQTLTLSYAHYQDDQATRSNGAIVEVTAPMVPRLGGKASASYATVPQGPAALQGSVGLSWSPVAHLELSGEVGATRNASAAAGQPFPSRGPLDGLPIVGGGPPSNSSQDPMRQVHSTVLLGVRVTLP